MAKVKLAFETHKLDPNQCKDVSAGGGLITLTDVDLLCVERRAGAWWLGRRPPRCLCVAFAVDVLWVASAWCDAVVGDVC